ncbi:MAG: branched-chain amino acid aminotransferase, partial [Geminicoccales bacterium]
TAGEVQAIAEEGIGRFPKKTDLYIRPMFYAEEGFVSADPDSTRFCCTLFEAPLPSPKGIGVCLSRFRRPPPDMAPTDAKASCLYPNAARALREASAKGFDNAVMLDANGNVAELATANIWIARDGVAITPVPNGTFLAGITRARVACLLREAGFQVEERSVTWKDVLEADEVFTTGNYAKVLPIIRVEERSLQPGPLYKQARELYWRWAHNGRA